VDNKQQVTLPPFKQASIFRLLDTLLLIFFSSLSGLRMVLLRRVLSYDEVLVAVI